MVEGKEFVYFLVAGLAIIAIMLVAFGLQFTGYAAAGRPLVDFGSPVFVGEAEFDAVETLYASFDANNFLETKVYSLGSRRVSNGLLFGSSSVKADVGDASFLEVSFDVAGTNGYGPVMIKIDGKIVEEMRPEIGHYRVSLPAGREVELAAGSSDWRIWAPALYELENVRITANRYPHDISTYTFELDGPEKIKAARIDFSLDSNAGSLLLRLNGDTIYDGAVNSRQSVYIDSSKLGSLNMITFDARPDSRFAGRATIALTRKEVQDRQLIADINLTQAEYAKFSRGEISFDVVDVFRPGGYSVKVVNSNRILMNEFVKLERGYFVLNIKKQHLQPGLNTLIVTAVDGAAFNVQGLMTRLQ